MEWLSEKKKNCRVLVAKGPALNAPKTVVRTVIGGVLVQTADTKGAEVDEWKVVSKLQPTPQQMADLRFAWIAAKHVKYVTILPFTDT